MKQVSCLIGSYTIDSVVWYCSVTGELVFIVAGVLNLLTVYIHIYLYVYIYISIYLSIYIYIHIYIYIYIYIYICGAG